MKDILQSVDRFNTLIGEISCASREQSTGIERVNGSIEQMTVRHAERGARRAGRGAAQSLKDQSARLRQAVGAFKLAA